MFITTLLIFVVILSILVLSHEMGHFIVAKLFGVRVEEFGLGLPPKIFGYKLGETIYSINLLPFGGFVRLSGEEGGKGEPREFASRSAVIKSFIVLAGVLMNFVLGYALITLGFTQIGIPAIVDHLSITEVVKDTPAFKAGLLAQDEILKINGQPFSGLDGLTSNIKANAGRKISLTVKRGQKELTIQIVPRSNPPAGQGALGVRLLSDGEVTYLHVKLREVPVKALDESFNLVGLMFGGLKSIAQEVFVQRIFPKDISGPVGIARITGEVAKQGFWQVINLVALLSFNLGVINILPFPGLDGGRFLFIWLEKIFGSRFSLKLQTFMNTVGIALLLLLMAVITYYDIARSF